MNYLFYDVFTDRPLLGNQLAVFTDGRGLTTAQMQAIAREINFSETTFILPAERADTDIRMRIFTPAVEMPMAGHPTVGSTFALAHVGVIPRGQSRFVFGLNVGPTPVDLEWDGDRLRFVWMTQAHARIRRCTSTIELRLPRPSGLAWTISPADLPIQEISCGVPYLIVPLRDRETVDRATPRPEAILELPGVSRAHPAILLFALDVVSGFSRTSEVRLKPDTTADDIQPDVRAGTRRPGGSRHRERGWSAWLLPRAARVRVWRRGATDGERAGREDGTGEPHPHLDHRWTGRDYGRKGRRGSRARRAGRVPGDTRDRGRRRALTPPIENRAM